MNFPLLLVFFSSSFFGPMRGSRILVLVSFSFAPRICTFVPLFIYLFLPYTTSYYGRSLYLSLFPFLAHASIPPIPSFLYHHHSPHMVLLIPALPPCLPSNPHPHLIPHRLQPSPSLPPSLALLFLPSRISIQVHSRQMPPRR